MEWLNYHHLLYFYTVAREGGLAPAARVLRLSHPTLSSQIHALEARLGEKLFEKAGRKLALTEMGRVVYRYADEIFSLGNELLDVVHDRPTGRAPKLDVGVVDAVPKIAVHRILAPAYAAGAPVRLVCREGKFTALLQALAAHELDVVVADAAPPPGAGVRAFAHALGETGTTLFAAKAKAAAWQRRFPAGLDGAPLLLPAASVGLRRALDRWIEAEGLRPLVRGEFEDSALMKAFGAAGEGIFPGPTALEREIQAQYAVAVVGRLPEVRERFYLVTAERRIKNPAVVALSEAAKRDMFAA